MVFGSRDPGEMFAELARRHSQDPVNAWLENAARTALDTEGAVSFERALNLPRGKRAGLARRNHWLCVAHRLCDGELSWTRAQQLEKELVRFRLIAPNGCLNKGLKESQLSALRQALLHAHRQGCQMPATLRHLWSIVR